VIVHVCPLQTPISRRARQCSRMRGTASQSCAPWACSTRTQTPALTTSPAWCPPYLHLLMLDTFVRPCTCRPSLHTAWSAHLLFKSRPLSSCSGASAAVIRCCALHPALQLGLLTRPKRRQREWRFACCSGVHHLQGARCARQPGGQGAAVVQVGRRPQGGGVLGMFIHDQRLHEAPGLPMRLYSCGILCEWESPRQTLGSACTHTRVHRLRAIATPETIRYPASWQGRRTSVMHSPLHVPPGDGDSAQHVLLCLDTHTREPRGAGG